MNERESGRGRETEIVSKSDIKRETEKQRDGELEVDKRGNQSINESITGPSVPHRLLRSS